MPGYSRSPFFGFQSIFKDHGLAIAPLSYTTTTTYTDPYSLIVVDATSAGFTFTLPLASTSRGRELWIVKSNAANTVTISRAGADVIGFAGATTIALSAQDGVVHLVNDGATRWIRLQG